MLAVDERALLRSRLEGRHANVAVVGLGYVGLPLAVALAQVGHRVVGIDRSPARIDATNAGHSDIRDVQSSEVSRLVNTGRLSATNDYAAGADADAIVIAVPTPIDTHRVPDLTAVKDAANAISSVMKPGSLVVLESTTYPGTTEEIIVPAIRRRGLTPGLDAFVGYSPERIDPANRVWRLTNTPKVIAGLTRECLEMTASLYGTFVETLVPVSDLRTAEITKLFENTFRFVNIALANEFQQICDGFGIDVWETIEACATKPYGFMPFYPGPGLGGHCIPVDPLYLAWKAREQRLPTQFIELADRITAQMHTNVVAKVARLLNTNRRAINSSHVSVLGVAYKRNTPDIRESPAVPIIRALRREAAIVSYHDPHVPSLCINGEEFLSEALSTEYLSQQDCIVVLTDHDSIDWTLISRHAHVTVDTRNALGRLSYATAQSEAV